MSVFTRGAASALALLITSCGVENVSGPSVIPPMGPPPSAAIDTPVNVVSRTDQRSGIEAAFAGYQAAKTYQVGPFKANYFSNGVWKTKETVTRPALNYPWNYFYGISAKAFEGEWVGFLKVTGESTNIDINFDVSKADVWLYIDGELVKGWSNKDKVITQEFNEGLYEIRVEQENHWHSANFNVSFTDYPKYTIKEADDYLDQFADPDTQVIYVGASQSEDWYNETTVNLDVTAEDVFLFLNSSSAVNWTINNPNEVNIRGVAFGSNAPGSTISVQGISKVLEVTDFRFDVSDDFTTPILNINSMIERKPDCLVDGSGLPEIDVTDALCNQTPEQVCADFCLDKECGPNGCGGFCGSCHVGSACGPEGLCVDATMPPDCDAATSDPHYCMTMTDTGAALLGLESGNLCPIGPQTGVLIANGPGSPSIAWQDDYVFTCGGYSGVYGLLRFSLLDGSWDVAPIHCSGVASWKHGLLVMVDPSEGLGDQLIYYESFEDAKQEGLEQVKPGKGLHLFIDLFASRFTVRGDTLYGAWHSTDSVYVYGLPDGTQEGVIHLEGYDTWVWGVSVTDDGLLVLSDGSSEDRVVVFDVESGKQLWEITDLPLPGPHLTGLVCVTR